MIAYQKKLLSLQKPEKKKLIKEARLDIEMEKQRLKIVRSFCIAKQMYDHEHINHMRRNKSMHDGMQALKALLHNNVHVDFDENNKSLEVGAKFLEVSE